MTARWRGTIVYAGSLAVIGAAAFARFGGTAEAGEGAAQAVVPVSGVTSPAPPSADPSPTASAEPADTAGPATAEPTTAAEPEPAAEATTAAPATPAEPPAAAEPAEQDVTVTGAVSRTKYGPVQVAVTFSAGQIVEVITVQAPEEHRESVRINDRALPILRQEALAAQSAQIDTVSGATYTSEGYRASLQSAIDQRA